MSTVPVYVPLRRRFTPVGSDPSTWLSRRMLGDQHGKRWNDIVPVEPPDTDRSALVILAPSGVGKTAELRARADELSAAGVPTFLLRAIDVATSGLSGPAIDPSALQNWKGTTDHAVFFVDAIDEARLAGFDLEQVLRRFAHEIDPATKRFQLVVSSRNDVWSDDDMRHLIGLLSLRIETAPINVVRLEPLALDDITQFAAAKGIGDVEAFAAAIREDELDQVMLDMRPADAQTLVDYWKQHRQFGSWSEMLEA